MDDLAFVPLGGAGAFGANLTAYRADGRWLLVDCGAGFDRISVHETRVLDPDPGFLAGQDLAGLVLTHAHFDHLGAVPTLWPRLRCPIVATPFPARILEGRLVEAGLREQVPLRIVPPGGAVAVGPFEVTFVPITHSTIEASLVAIRTRHGLVAHTGDWKLDPAPQLGPPTDEAALRRLGDEGVLAVVGDSTNAPYEGHTPSEALVVESLRALLRDRPGRVLVTCFASHVARVLTLIRLAEALGRHAVLIGGSLFRGLEAARWAGYLDALPAVVDARDAGYLPPDRVLLICGGSQGEPNGTLSRIARDAHPTVKLDPGDLVVFSAKRIPGNELLVERVQRELRALGCEIVDADDALVHVSGHPARGDLRTLYGWLRPRYVVPVHGDVAHLEAHADLARELGLAALEVLDGDLVRLAPGAPALLGRVGVGRIPRQEEDRPDGK